MKVTGRHLQVAHRIAITSGHVRRCMVLAVGALNEAIHPTFDATATESPS